MEKYFKRKSMSSCDEQNVSERNDREKRDQNNVNVNVNVDVDVDVGDVDVGDVGGIGDVGDVGNVGGIGDIGDVDVAQLPSDPGLRVSIQNYDINVRDVIQRAYVQRGLCQSRNHAFPPTRMGNKDK
ncbi:uncharacterized protein LOC111394591 [Olea europaea var. sylvestris]|uniref:uncharacterized protein LOC111394591 n=1 Tax=Olea europaea var. sylvestris TaxID=158386 RepID=UPI000C1CF7EB|nr:uncharacterized protein LOC111394591 [Olea europaea var. sylvestris]XP_022876258.1 uncharacterized protein LOC111394591 [Olea europaea var. sylvestris]XP_022876259.1 uncharacterized protein LOC111394591 [Olea europaea var. sylvestris]